MEAIAKVMCPVLNINCYFTTCVTKGCTIKDTLDKSAIAKIPYPNHEDSIGE